MPRTLPWDPTRSTGASRRAQPAASRSVAVFEDRHTADISWKQRHKAASAVTVTYRAAAHHLGPRPGPRPRPHDSHTKRTCRGRRTYLRGCSDPGDRESCPAVNRLRHRQRHCRRGASALHGVRMKIMTAWRVVQLSNHLLIWLLSTSPSDSNPPFVVHGASTPLLHY